MALSANKTHPLRRRSKSLAGRVFAGRYRIVEPIGEGAAGAVFMARDVLKDRTVALKVIAPDGIVTDESVSLASAVENALHEALTVSRLGSPHVIDIFQAGREPDGLVFLAMEYLHGVDLQRLLASEAQLPWPRCLEIATQTAHALETVHQAGLVHGDVKPANIFLTRDNDLRDYVKILDFGLARLSRGAFSEGPEPAPSRVPLGTPSYMAPEQVLGLPLAPASDVYSLGCVIYQMITGEPPFHAATNTELMAKQVHEPVTPPKQRRPDLRVAVSLDDVVMRALEKDPRRRWASMADFAAALAQCRFGVETAEQLPLPRFRAPPEPARWRRRFTWTLVALVMAATVSLAVGLLARLMRG